MNDHMKAKRCFTTMWIAFVFFLSTAIGGEFLGGRWEARIGWLFTLIVKGSVPVNRHDWTFSFDNVSFHRLPGPTPSTPSRSVLSPLLISRRVAYRHFAQFYRSAS